MMSVIKSERGMATRGYRSSRHSASERRVQTRPNSMEGTTSQLAGMRFAEKVELGPRKTYGIVRASSDVEV